MMSGTHNAARLREALAIVLKEGAGLLPPRLEDAVLVARLGAVCAGLHDRPRLTPQELLAFAQGERFEPVFRNLLLESFSDKKTAFFRDKEIFSYVSENLMSEDLMKKSGQKTVKVWCAACSTGQEALSFAMAWHRRLQRTGASDETKKRLVVYASDLSARAISVASAGRYNNFDVQHGLNVHDLLDFFDEQKGGGFWKAKDALLSHTVFFQHNLLRSPPSLLPRDLDAIFLPHTLQDFDDALAESVLVRLTALLAPDGWLALAPHEADKYDGRLFSQQQSNAFASPPPRGLFSRRDFAYPDRGKRVLLRSDSGTQGRISGFSMQNSWQNP